jgi:hypothetical protein
LNSANSRSFGLTLSNLWPSRSLVVWSFRLRPESKRQGHYYSLLVMWVIASGLAMHVNFWQKYSTSFIFKYKGRHLWGWLRSTKTVNKTGLESLFFESSLRWHKSSTMRKSLSHINLNKSLLLNCLWSVIVSVFMMLEEERGCVIYLFAVERFERKNRFVRSAMQNQTKQATKSKIITKIFGRLVNKINQSIYYNKILPFM